MKNKLLLVVFKTVIVLRKASGFPQCHRLKTTYYPSYLDLHSSVMERISFWFPASVLDQSCYYWVLH